MAIKMERELPVTTNFLMYNEPEGTPGRGAVKNIVEEFVGDASSRGTL